MTLRLTTQRPVHRVMGIREHDTEDLHGGQSFRTDFLNFRHVALRSGDIDAIAPLADTPGRPAIWLVSLHFRAFTCL